MELLQETGYLLIRVVVYTGGSLTEGSLGIFFHPSECPYKLMDKEISQENISFYSGSFLRG